MNNISLSRRQFLARTALASAALCGGALPAFAAQKFAPPVAVFSKVYQALKLNFDDAAALTAEAGLDGIDCPVRNGGEISPDRASDDLPRYAEALQKRNLKIHLLTTGITSAGSPHTEDVLRAAKKLGVKYYRLGFYNRDAAVPVEKQIAEIKAQLKDVAALNRQIGITGLFQNHSPAGETYVGGNLPELHEVTKDFNPDEIGIAFDIGHAILVHGDKWRSEFEKLKSHLKIAYVKDVKRGGRFVPFGEGDIGASGYFKVLKEMNYSAPISMHIEFNWAGADGSKTRAELLRALQQSLSTLKHWLAEA